MTWNASALVHNDLTLTVAKAKERRFNFLLGVVDVVLVQEMHGTAEYLAECGRHLDRGNRPG